MDSERTTVPLVADLSHATSHTLLHVPLSAWNQKVKQKHHMKIGKGDWIRAISHTDSVPLVAVSSTSLKRAISANMYRDNTFGVNFRHITKQGAQSNEIRKQDLGKKVPSGRVGSLPADGAAELSRCRLRRRWRGNALGFPVAQQT